MSVSELSSISSTGVDVHEPPAVIPYITITTVPADEGGELHPSGTVDSRLPTRVILPMHAAHHCGFIANCLQGLLGLPGCEVALFGEPRGFGASSSSVASPPHHSLSAVSSNNINNSNALIDSSHHQRGMMNHSNSVTAREPQTTPASMVNTGRSDAPYGRREASDDAATAIATTPRVPPPPPHQRLTDLTRTDFFSPPASFLRSPFTARSGIRCQWGRHPATAASFAYSEYVRHCANERINEGLRKERAVMLAAAATNESNQLRVRGGGAMDEEQEEEELNNNGGEVRVELSGGGRVASSASAAVVTVHDRSSSSGTETSAPRHDDDDDDEEDEYDEEGGDCTTSGAKVKRHRKRRPRKKLVRTVSAVMDEAQRSEAIYGQTEWFKMDYIPVAVPSTSGCCFAADAVADCATAPSGSHLGVPSTLTTLPASSTTTAGAPAACTTEDDGGHNNNSSSSRCERFHCAASNSIANMPVFPLPQLTEVALDALSEHMVCASMVPSTAPAVEVMLVGERHAPVVSRPRNVCDVLGTPAQVARLPRDEQARAYYAAIDILGAAAFLQM